jgi:hypothetical protein
VFTLGVVFFLNEIGLDLGENERVLVFEVLKKVLHFVEYARVSMILESLEVEAYAFGLV